MNEHAEMELAHRYAAGQLDAARSAAFEHHLLVCEACQTEVRIAVGLRRITRPAGGARRARGRWIVAGGAALAAGMAAVLVLSTQGGRELAALGEVRNPPAYVGMSVRAMPQSADSLFDAAMTAYVARQYMTAASGLAAALAAGIDTIPAEFFLASAQLMAGRPADAEAGYARVVSAGDRAGPYLAEARLYRARALLRLGRANEALAELAAVGGADAATRRTAALLADSVTRVIQR